MMQALVLRGTLIAESRLRGRPTRRQAARGSSGYPFSGLPRGALLTLVSRFGGDGRWIGFLPALHYPSIYWWRYVMVSIIQP